MNKVVPNHRARKILQMVRTFEINIAGKKGSYCYRCGIEKKEIRKEKIPCSAYGRNYNTHLYK